jgi:hypothetical protein
MMKQDFTGTGIRHGQFAGSYQPFDYLLYLIAYHSAPVLVMEKPAVLLIFSNERLRRLNDIWREYQNRIPRTENFQYYELCRTPDRTAVLFFHPDLLRNALREKASAQFLIASGYRKKLTLATALADLKKRFQQGCPHEIGIFLGIPLPDVLGFIENSGKKALAAGYWKVYHDPGSKLALFARYREAKNCFIRFMKAGNRPAEYLDGKLMALRRFSNNGTRGISHGDLVGDSGNIP